MALPTCNEDMNIISKLDDEPNDVGGLSAASLKAKFDLAGNLLKKALNDLVAALGNNAAAKSIGFTPTTAVNETNVQDAIENVQSQIAGVTQGGIADGAVTAEKIADGAVGTDAIADAAVTYDKIKDKAVGSAKLADNAVSAKKIASDAVQERQILDGAVTESKIGYYAVTANKIASKAVTGEKIADGAVTGAKIAPNAVTNEKIARGAVTAEKVAYKAMRTAVDISATVASPGNACTSYGGLYMHAHSIGLMFFSLTLKGLAAADVGKTVTVSFSGGEDYQRPGVSVGPDHVLRDLNVSSLTARIVYRDSDQNIVQVSALAYFTEAGQLAVQIPTGVVAGRNCEIFASGWYMA